MDRRYDIITTGMALVDSIVIGYDSKPVYGRVYRAEEGSLYAGGEAVNSAIAASKLGMNTAIFCHLGEDEAGRLVEETLKKYGVATDAILKDQHPTPVSTLLVDCSGERSSITNSAHRFNFRPDFYPERIADTSAVIVDSLFRAPFDDAGIIKRFLKQAKENGSIVFADTKIPNFRKLSLHDIRESLSLIDYITPNEDEARFFTGKTEPEEMAKVFYEAGAENVIIKLGSKGCYFRSAEDSGFIPAYDIQAVDATGAGDNFIAGLASEILRGVALQQALQFASACGAICATAAGASTALTGRQQVLEFMADCRYNNDSDII